MKHHLLMNHLIIIVIAVVVHQNAYVNCSVDVAAIKFKLYKLYTGSLEDTFVSSVEKPDLKDDLIGAAFDEAANQMPFGGGTYSAIKDHIESTDAYEAKVNSERRKATAIMNEISSHIHKYKQYEIKAQLDKLLYELGKPRGVRNLSWVDSELYGLILFFSKPDSPVWVDPAFGASVLLPLADFVESFMKILILEEKIKLSNKEATFDHIIPCALAETIKDYFIPTLFDRLDEIDMGIDHPNFVANGKFGQMYETLRAPFNPDGYTKWLEDPLHHLQCDKHDGDRGTFDKEVENQFPRKYVLKAMWEKVYKVNTEETGKALLKDNLGDQNEYFSNSFWNSHCAKYYFALVRHRLEREFGTAYKKVQKYCSFEKRATKTGNHLNTLK